MARLQAAQAAAALSLSYVRYAGWDVQFDLCPTACAVGYVMSRASALLMYGPFSC